jgi:hypothetical protein
VLPVACALVATLAAATSVATSGRKSFEILNMRFPL